MSLSRTIFELKGDPCIYAPAVGVPFQWRSQDLEVGGGIIGVNFLQIVGAHGPSPALPSPPLSSLPLPSPSLSSLPLSSPLLPPFPSP